MYIKSSNSDFCEKLIEKLYLLLLWGLHQGPCQEDFMGLGASLVIVKARDCQGKLYYWLSNIATYLHG